jgi:hypothetical protein
MAANFPLLDRELFTFSERADRVRQDLYYCDTTISATTRTLRQNVHAASYVYLAAALEAYVKQTLGVVCLK